MKWWIPDPHPCLGGCGTILEIRWAKRCYRCNRAHVREKARVRYRELRERGVCVDCGKVPAFRAGLCEPHWERKRESHRKSKAKRQRRDPLSANVRETRSTQRIRVGRRQRKRTCWDCEREWKRMVVPLEPGRPSEARQLLRTRRVVDRPHGGGSVRRTSCGSSKKRTGARSPARWVSSCGERACTRRT